MNAVRGHYTDPVGDATGSAPDIQSLTVYRRAHNIWLGAYVYVAVLFCDTCRLVHDSRIVLRVDLDHNRRTGSPLYGAEARAVASFPQGGDRAVIQRWTGSSWHTVQVLGGGTPHQDVLGRRYWNDRGIIVRLRSSMFRTSRTVGFSVVSSGSSGLDRAPDGGTFAYAVRTGTG